MELTIQATAAVFLAKAMAMAPPPPPPVQLARKRSWTEMSHLRSAPYISTPPPASLQLKKSKHTLASSSNGVVRFPADDDCFECASMSADAQQFLANDPFDFEAPPHPVLKRQQAVYNVCEFISNDPTADDDMTGLALGSAPVMPLPPRWNVSAVSASLSNANRLPSGIQPWRM
jgi:hypothetical protein